ncbi:MAG: hypothetical protein L0Y55_00775 [Anaerolineales bacterium]|nr:hypothetical protein [Anaerolineales bacterium]
MKPISAEIVETTWKRIADFSAREGKALAEKFAAEQPIVMAYLMAVDAELFDEEERELLFYLGAAVWQMLTQGDAPLPQVTEQMIDQAEAANQAMLEPLANAPDDAARAVMAKLLQDYAQPEVFKYVVTALMESAQDEGIREENLGVMMVDLKTVIDGLNS